MDGTIITQGSFTSTGASKIINIPQGTDWITVYNYSNAGAMGNNSVRFYWQNGMASGTGLREFKSGGTNALNMTVLASPNGFTPVDTSSNSLTASVAITAATNATTPVVSTASTAGLSVGSIIRLTNVIGAQDLSGYDYSISAVVANTSFTLAPTLANAPGAAGTGGSYRIVQWPPEFYPRHRFIVNALRPQDGGGVAGSTVFTTSIPSGYQVGQDVRVIVLSPFFSMTQINNTVGTITAINDALGTQTVTVNIDSSTFSAFTFPTAAQAAVPYTRAMLVPAGMDTATAIAASTNILSDATINQSVLGMLLPGGADAPGGANGNIMYWRAGHSQDVSTT